MKRSLLAASLFAATQLATGCQTEADVRPSTYDTLALETGHWEWDGTGYQKSRRTPATEGFTRQLVFTAGGDIVITHNGQPNKKTPYVLSMGTLPACTSGQAVPIITFETDSDVPNNDRKTYYVSTSGTNQQLLLTGEAACVDAGAYETYHWVKE
ncbi:MAG: hypothetical protein ACRYFX_28145 [Janthinobacterium lividum]